MGEVLTSIPINTGHTRGGIVGGEGWGEGRGLGLGGDEEGEGDGRRLDQHAHQHRTHPWGGEGDEEG